jgi:hypothetical protein
MVAEEAYRRQPVTYYFFLSGEDVVSTSRGPVISAVTICKMIEEQP